METLVPKYDIQLVLTGHTHNQKFLDAEGNRVRVYTDGYYGNVKPLFVQTRSATKDENGFTHGYLEVKVDAHGMRLFPHPPQGVIISPDYLLCSVTGSVNLHAYDSQGRHTGLGSVDVNIPDSFYTGNYNGTAPSMPQMILLYNTNDSYEFKVTSNLEPSNVTKQTLTSEENESFNLTIKKQINNSFETISFNNVSILENTTASVSVTPINPVEMHYTLTAPQNYTMEIDYDGDGEVDEVKSPDSIETNYAPDATIISPENNSIFVLGDEIAFNGNGTDPEDGVLTNTSLVWSSDRDGLIGVGNEFNTSNLSAGMHTITLMVNDSADLIDTASVEILINAPDLTLNSSDISFSTSNPTEGEIVTINATIRNKGLINATNVIVQFFDGIPEFEISNVTINAIQAGEHETVNVTWNTTGKMGNHSISVMIDPYDSIEEMNETNNQASKSIVVSEEQTQITFFDTGKGTYPSIMGNHTGTIKPNHTVIATKLYTYSCSGTGGHTEYAKIGNLTWNATATWEGYVEDWHNITFDKTVVLLANETYDYTIRTGSYPQIIHEQNYTTLDGSFINCTKFTDANGKTYTNWIPAIRLH